MKSHEVLKQVIEEVGTKRVAAELKVSNSLVYKWCQEPPEIWPMSDLVRETHSTAW